MTQFTIALRLPSLCFMLCCSILLAPIYADCDAVNNKGTTNTGDFSLGEVFRALRNTIPQQTLNAIWSNHMSQDAQFQEAVKFLHSAQFSKVSQTISHSAQYQQLLHWLQRAGVNTQDIETLASLVEIFETPAAIATNNNIVNFNAVDMNIDDDIDDDDDYDDDYDDDDDDFEVNARSRRFARKQRCALTSLFNDLAFAIDRQNFMLVLNKYLRVNRNFAKFYAIVSKRRNQRFLLKHLAAANLRQPLRLLKAHAIDLRYLLSRCFKLLSGLPKIY